MKRVLIVVVLVIGAATLGLWRSHGGVRQGLSRAVGASSDDCSCSSVRVVFHRRYRQNPQGGLRVLKFGGPDVCSSPALAPAQGERLGQVGRVFVPRAIDTIP